MIAIYNIVGGEVHIPRACGYFQEVACSHGQALSRLVPLDVPNCDRLDRRFAYFIAKAHRSVSVNRPMSNSLPNCPTLQAILETKSVQLADGTPKPLTSATSSEECVAMYKTLKELRPATAIEIGMAYGVSALTMLSTMEELAHGKLISLDPYFKWETGRLSATAAIERAGLSHRHEHRHEPSELALPKLVEEGIRCQFVYIDGHHGFDHAFVDMFFADQLLDVGGILAFDDSQWRAVHRVIRYLQTNRSYEELNIGMKRHYRSSNPFFAMVKRLQGRFGTSRYFRKVEDWKAPYHFYRHF